MRRRVVVTGIGITSPIGNDLSTVSRSLQEGRSGVRSFPEWGEVKSLRTRLGAPSDVDLSTLPRKRTRTMGRVAQLATWATQNAINEAGLSADLLSSGRVGIAYGSTSGSTASIQEFVGSLVGNRSLDGIQSATYLRFMSHTCAANLAQYFAVRGRVHTTCSACVSSSQAIGYAFEAVRSGAQDVMLAGGAEELGVTAAAIFDIMFATSAGFNDRPAESPRPFDAARDGLVVGEGAGTLVLESLESATARGATIHAEILGFGTNCDGYHMTAPHEDGMARVIELALEDARLPADKIEARLRAIPGVSAAIPVLCWSVNMAGRRLLSTSLPPTFMQLFFETISAAGEVGFSCNLTPSLTASGRGSPGSGPQLETVITPKAIFC